MKLSKLALMIIITSSTTVMAENILNPMDFKGTKVQKDQVIEFIKKTVHRDYCERTVDLCSESTINMMEHENMRSFKNATHATNRKIMDNVIDTYCNRAFDMCSYTTIWMMYQENFRASKRKLNF